MLTCAWYKSGLFGHGTQWEGYVRWPWSTHQLQNHTQTKNSEGTFADRHALWDIKKALLTNPPSSTNKSYWFPNNTSPWMHSPTSSAQPHTSTINNLHNKRPLCVKAYSLAIIAMIYSVSITYWQLSLIYMIQHVTVYWGLYSLVRGALIFIRAFSTDEGHLGKNTRLLVFHIPVSFNSFTHGMRGEECLAVQ